MDSEKYAYVTVLTTDTYLIGVLALKECLNRVKSKYKLVVLINNSINEKTIKIMKNFNIEIIKINSVEIPQRIMTKNAGTNYNRWSNTFDKLRVFGLIQFDKIIYLDSDMYIRKNIDHLFEAENMSAVIDRHYCTIDSNYMELTSGILVIEPKKNLDIQIAKKIPTCINKFEQFGDQDVIQQYYTDWKLKDNLHLPLTYNMFILHLEYFIKEEEQNKLEYKDFKKIELNDLNIIHFICKKKPWDFKIDEIDKYIEFLNDIRKKDYEECDIEEQRKMFEAEFELSQKYTKMITLEYMEIIQNISKKIGI